jgi:hypothetical protein
MRYVHHCKRFIPAPIRLVVRLMIKWLYRFIGSLLVVVAVQFWRRKKGSPPTSLDFVNDPELRRELEEFERFDRERKSGVGSPSSSTRGGAGGISGATPSPRFTSPSQAHATATNDRFDGGIEGVHSYDIDQPISDDEYARLLRQQHDRKHGHTSSSTSSSSSSTTRAAINAAMNNRGMELPRRAPTTAHDRALSSSSTASFASNSNNGNGPPIVTSYDIDRPILDDEADEDVELDGEAHAFGDSNGSNDNGDDGDDHSGHVHHDGNGEGDDMTYEYEPEWEHPDSYLVGARAADGSPLANAPPHPFNDPRLGGNDEDDDNDDINDNDSNNGHNNGTGAVINNNAPTSSSSSTSLSGQPAPVVDAQTKKDQ